MRLLTTGRNKQVGRLVAKCPRVLTLRAECAPARPPESYSDRGDRIYAKRVGREEIEGAELLGATAAYRVK